jgi:hypothetical protein
VSLRKSATKGARLGTRMRGDLEEAFNLRGSQKAFMFNSYSLKRQSDVVISGKLRFLHFLHAESDPGIETVNYWPSAPASLPRKTSAFTPMSSRLAESSNFERCVPRCYGHRQASASTAKSCLTRYRQFPKLSLGKYRSVEFQVLTRARNAAGTRDAALELAPSAAMVRARLDTTHSGKPSGYCTRDCRRKGLATYEICWQWPRRGRKEHC